MNSESMTLDKLMVLFKIYVLEDKAIFLYHWNERVPEKHNFKVKIFLYTKFRLLPSTSSKNALQYSVASFDRNRSFTRIAKIVEQK